MTPITPGPQAPHRTPTADVEAHVLDAADRLVVDAGPAALSIRLLAKEADVAPMTIYNRFGDKAGVLQALFKRGFDELGRHTRNPELRRHGLSPEEARSLLRTSGLDYRRFAKASPGTYSLMFDRSPAVFEPDVDGLETATRAFDGLVDLVAQTQAAKGIVGGSAAEIAQRIWATIHGAVSLELRSMCFVDDTDQHFEAVLDTLLVGLSPDRGVPGITP